MTLQELQALREQTNFKGMNAKELLANSRIVNSDIERLTCALNQLNMVRGITSETNELIGDVETLLKQERSAYQDILVAIEDELLTRLDK